MLAIRMQRTGRKGHPMYRVIVQDSHRQPTSGRIVANLGSYNPHTKETTLDKEQAAVFLKNGAQPSDRVVHLLRKEKVALPEWVKVTSVKKQKSIKNVEKLRRNQPAEEKETPVVAEVEAPAADIVEAPAEVEETVSEETKAPEVEEAVTEESPEEKEA